MTGTVQMHACASRHSTWLRAPFQSRAPKPKAVVSAAGVSTQAQAGVEQQPGQGLATHHARRACLAGVLGVLTSTSLPALAEPKYEQMEGIKGKDYGKVRTKYPDFVLTESGLQYKDLRDGSGESAHNGSHVTIDWDGYTIGYYGRPFEARNKTKGGAFVGDEKDFFRFKVGEQKVIPAFEEAIIGMKVGGVRRLIVPVELGYPGQPPDFTKLGPTPGNFSGRRALDFVLKNQGLIDKTLLFDIELMGVK